MNNYYKAFFGTNDGKGININDKIMINENIQYNYNELFKEKNNLYNIKEDDNINIIIKQFNDKDKNGKMKMSNYIDNKNIFSQLNIFSRKKNGNFNEKNSKNLQENKGKENENIERRTIYTNNKYEDSEKEYLMEKNNLKLSNSKSYKIVIEKGKITPKGNKDILSLFGNTKYEDKLQKLDKNKENEKDNYYLHNNNNNQIYTENNKYINKNNEINNTENGDEEKEVIMNNNNNDISDNSDANEEYEEEENLNSFENEDVEESNEDSNISQLTDKNQENNNQENNNNIITLNQEEQNNINSQNILPSEQSQNERRKNNRKKTEKKSQSKSKKNKAYKFSPDKIISTKEISDSKAEQEKSKYNSNERKKRNILLNNEIVLTNKSNKNRNKRKITSVFKKAKIPNKNYVPKKRRKKMLLFEERKKFSIKDFESLDNDEKIIKRNVSNDNISRHDNDEMNLKGEVNVIKFHDNDMDQIVNFINEEERRRIRIKKNEEKIIEEKRRKSKSNLYSLFKIKEKKKKQEKTDDLTRETLVEKLQKNDWRIRQYLEDIMRAGLTLGNKEINKRMKNKSILVFQGNNLGTFKFKKNFGIKEEVDIEPFRPLSHERRIQKNAQENKEKESEKYLFKKDNKEKMIKVKNKGEILEEKERKRLKKIEEAKKKLIYDNRYLFEKKKPSIKYILRKEVEEILQGGIFLQQLTKSEEEKNIELNNRFLPKRSKFIKKKKYRGKLFRKSQFLNEVNKEIIPIKENNYSSSESEIKEESEHNFEDKMQNFINRIKKLIKGEELNLDEIELIMNQKNERNQKEKEKEIRMREFLHTLNEYRDMNKNIRIKNDNFSYKLPIIITSYSDI